MKIKLISIGNSKGLRLPKSLIQQYKISEDVEIELKEEGIMLKPIVQPRKGWTEQFETAVKPVEFEEQQWMVARNHFDKEEWTW